MAGKGRGLRDQLELVREIEVNRCEKSVHRAYEYWTEHTWQGFIIVDEMRGAAEEFCQFASTPQELLALLRGERVRSGRGLGKGDDRVGHGRPAVGRRKDGDAHLMGRFLWVITRLEAKCPSFQATQKWWANSLCSGPIRWQSPVPVIAKTQ